MTQLNLFEQRNVTGRVSEVVVGRITFAPPPLPDMLGQPPANGTATSIMAADAIKPHANMLRYQVLECIRAAGRDGLTDEQVQDALGMPGNTERPRRRELFMGGRIVAAPEMRKTRSGRMANVWSDYFEYSPYFSASARNCANVSVPGVLLIISIGNVAVYSASS